MIRHKSRLQSAAVLTAFLATIVLPLNGALAAAIPKPAYDVAQTARGATISGGTYAHVNNKINNEKIIDGRTNNYSDTSGYGQTTAEYPVKSEDKIIIELDQLYTLNTVKVQLLDTNFNQQAAFIVEASANGTDWTKVMDRSAHAVRSLQVATFDDMNVKYFRISSTVAVPDGLLKIVELQAYYQRVPSSVEYLAKPKKDVALSSKGAIAYGSQYHQYFGMSSATMIDGDVDKFTMQYVSGSTRDEDDLYVELKDHFNINTIEVDLYDKIYDEYSFTVQVSADGKNWTKVMDRTKNLFSGIQKEVFEDTAVKYIRIHPTDAKTDSNVPAKLFRVREVRAYYTPIKMPKTDVALTSEGATISAGTHPYVNEDINNENIIDGSHEFTADSGYGQTVGAFPVSPESKLMIELDNYYKLNFAKIHLLDAAFDQQYAFQVEASSNGIDWKTVIDRNSKAHRSIQANAFDDMIVKYFRISSTVAVPDGLLKVVEFEAYYIPTPEGDVFESCSDLPAHDVALSSRGAQVYGGQYPIYIVPEITNGKMIDGKSDTGSTMQHIHPKNIDSDDLYIHLNKCYTLDNISVELGNGDIDEFSFTVQVSADGKTWKTVMDRTASMVSGNQTEYFEDSKVLFIRIHGTDAKTTPGIPNKLLFIDEVRASHS